MLTLTLPVAVYRFFDAEDRLLYVGISDSLGARFGAHRKRAAWWPDAVRNTVEWYDNRHEALGAEYDAITTEGPIHNVLDVAFPRYTREQVEALPLAGPPQPRRKYREKGTGCLTYRADRNLWVARVSVGYRVKEVTSRNKATAERKLAELLAAREAGEL